MLFLGRCKKIKTQAGNDLNRLETWTFGINLSVRANRDHIHSLFLILFLFGEQSFHKFFLLGVEVFEYYLCSGVIETTLAGCLDRANDTSLILRQW